MDLENQTIFAFQTGRAYAAEGQIILLVDMSDYVLMYDVTRGVDYALPKSVGLNAQNALDAYDSRKLEVFSDYLNYYRTRDGLDNLYRSGSFDSLKITI